MSKPGTGNPNCAETHATFRLRGITLDPDEVTRSLGVEPTMSLRPGDIRGGPRVPVRAKTGIWLLESERAVDSTQLEEHLVYLLDRLSHVPEGMFQALRKTGLEMDFHCYWMSETGQGGPVLSPEVIRRIGVIGAELDFDFYSAV